VLWALAIVAVRQQTHQARLAQPLGLTAGQELVKDDLRSVGKVACETSWQSYVEVQRHTLSQVDFKVVADSGLLRSDLCSVCTCYFER
jgi:hypothetical protein